MRYAVTAIDKTGKFHLIVESLETDSFEHALLYFNEWRDQYPLYQVTLYDSKTQSDVYQQVAESIFVANGEPFTSFRAALSSVRDLPDYEIRENGQLIKRVCNGFDVPAVGMPCTLCLPNDSYPFTVIRIVSNSVIEIQADNHTHVPGTFYESQEYVYSPNPEGVTHLVRCKRNGTWHHGGIPIVFGFRRYYQSPSI